MICWYALHVRSQHEHLVSDQLFYAGIEALYPHVVGRSKDGRRDVETKFFPGYVFGHFDIDAKTPVMAIPQIVSILGWGTHAVAIPDFEIAAVRLIVEAPVFVAVTPCPYVAEGDRVRVLRGPLRGLEGYVAYSKTATRVIVSVSMLARSISVDVDTSYLHLIERRPMAAA